MKVEYKDFIGIYTDVFEEGFCEHLIKQFEVAETQGILTSRKEWEGTETNRKNDFSFAFHGEEVETAIEFNGMNPIRLFYMGLDSCLQDYMDRYSELRNHPLNTHSMKFQKTTDGGGYHVWHCERNVEPTINNRVLTYMLYLNTLPPESNGETEFLYQKERIRPVKNTILIWPADFTHVHRGNPVYNNTKYIVTGWLKYAP